MVADESPSRVPPGAIAAVVFVVATLILLMLLVRTEGGDGMVRLGDYEPRTVEEAVDDGLSPVTLRPTRRLRVTASRIRWVDPSGRTFLEAPRAVTMVELNAAPDGAVLLVDGVVQTPRLHLIQTGEGSWNYERPLAPFFRDDPAGRGQSGLSVRMRNVRVANAHVILDLLDARYEARSLDAALASAHLTGPGLEAPVFMVRAAETELILPDTAGGHIPRDVAIANARLRVIDGVLAFDVQSGTFGTSRLASIEGSWNPALGPYGLDMSMTAIDARLADLPWLPGAVPEGTAGSFRLSMEPRPGGRSVLTLTDLDLTAPGSSASGSLRAVLGGPQAVLEAVDLRVDPLSLDLVEAFTGPLPYGGTVRGTVRGTDGQIRFDLAGLLTTPTIPDPFSADLVGRITLTEEGFTLGQADVALDQVPLEALRAVAPGLPLAGPISGTLGFVGTPGASPLQLDIRLEAGGGIVLLSGTVDVTRATPSYDLTGQMIGVRLQSLVQPSIPPAEVHGEFTLVGRGLTMETVQATLAADGRFTGWVDEPGDTLAARLSVDRGVVNVQTLRFDIGPIQAAAVGEWDYMRGDGALSYEAVVADLSPLAPYVFLSPTGERRFARGTLQLSGTVSGTLADPALAGEVHADAFRWGEWAAESFDSDYTVVLFEGLPRIDAELTAGVLRTPFGNFDALEGRIDFGQPNFEVAVRADQEGDRGILELQADGVIDDLGRREIFLRSLEVDLRDRRWGLPEPARIAWTVGDAVALEGVELLQADGDGRVALEGIVAPLDEMDLAVDVRGVPLGDVLELVGSDVELTGDLALQGRIAGPAATPDLDLTLSLAGGSFRGVAVRAVESEIRYAAGRLEVGGIGLLGDSARIEVSGTLPARIQLAGAPLFALSDDGEIDLQILTHTFPLATLDPGLTIVEDLAGRLQADISVSGSPSAPRLSGSAQLTNGRVRVPALDRRFENIRGTILLSGREARLQDMVVESDGTAAATGTLDFQQLLNPSLDMAVALERFRIQGVPDERSAGLWGDVRISGSLREPVLSGSVRADDGAFSLAPLQQPELSTRLAQGDVELLDSGADLDLGTSVQEGGLRIQNFQVQAGNELWLVSEELRARLNGTLTVNMSGASTSIQGTLQGEGGTFRLAVGPINRQFDIVSAEIRFFGSPEPNPRLDIVASRLVRVPDGADVDVLVRVGGTLSNPSLGLATAAGTDIPESELLSFILFGRPTSDLGQVAGTTEGGAGFVGQGVAYLGLAEVLGSQLNQEIGVFDYFRVDYVPGGGTFATVGVELGSEFLLTTEVLWSPEASNISAVALEYEAGIGTLRLGYDPVQNLNRLVGTRTLSYLRAEIIRQWALAWRKRWTY